MGQHGLQQGYRVVRRRLDPESPGDGAHPSPAPQRGGQGDRLQEQPIGGHDQIVFDRHRVVRAEPVRPGIPSHGQPRQAAGHIPQVAIGSRPPGQSQQAQQIRGQAEQAMGRPLPPAVVDQCLQVGQQCWPLEQAGRGWILQGQILLQEPSAGRAFPHPA